FLAAYAADWLELVDDRREIEISAWQVVRPFAATQYASSLAASDVNVAGYLSPVLLADECSHLRPRVERISDANVFCSACQALEYLVIDALLHQQPGSGETNLALILERGAEHNRHRFIQGCVFEQDGSAFAAQFERKALQRR